MSEGWKITRIELQGPMRIHGRHEQVITSKYGWEVWVEGPMVAVRDPQSGAVVEIPVTFTKGITRIPPQPPQVPEKPVEPAPEPPKAPPKKPRGRRKRKS